MPKIKYGQGGFYCFAHRGAMGYEPENTLAAFSKALDLGAVWVEADVHSAGGELFVIHDDRLDRTTNGAGRVSESSVAYLRTLDAGKGQKIPLLSEVLELLDARAGVNIELKGEGTSRPVAELIEEVLANSNWHADQFLVSSFDHPELLDFGRRMPEIRVGALTAGIPLDYAAFAEALGAWSVHASLEFVNVEFVADAHERGMRFFVYTVNEEDDLSMVRRMGADGIFTNYPDRFCGSTSTESA